MDPTTSPEVKVEALPAPEPVRLPRLREDLKLIGGPAHLDGSPSWRIQDPMRNSFFEIGWLEFELLARWREHRTLDTLREHVIRETQLRPETGEIEELITFLTANQLLRPDGAAVSMALECCVFFRASDFIFINYPNHFFIEFIYHLYFSNLCCKRICFHT